MEKPASVKGEKFSTDFILAIAFVIVIFVIGTYIGFFYELKFSSNPEHWGQLGDYFGGVLNPILAFFAFVILVRSYQIQKQELGATTAEMKVANEAQKELLKQQNQANQLQSFENLFFQLLQLKTQAFERIGINSSAYQDKSIWYLLNGEKKLSDCLDECREINSKIERIDSNLKGFEKRVEEFNLASIEEKDKKIRFATNLAIQSEYKISNDSQNETIEYLKKNNPQEFRDFENHNLENYRNYPNWNTNRQWFTEKYININYDENLLIELNTFFSKFIDSQKSKLVELKEAQTKLEGEKSNFGLEVIEYKNMNMLKKISTDADFQQILESNQQNIEMHLEIFKNYFYGSWSVYIREVGYQYFANYFRVCYQILNLINTHEAFQYDKNQTEDGPNDLQKRYAKIFRADLNESELQALLLNGTGIWGKKKFKPLLEKYKMFAQLDCNSENNGKELRNRTHIFDFAFHYDEKAFGNNENWQSYFELKKQDENKWRSKFKINQYGVDKHLKKLPEEKV